MGTVYLHPPLPTVRQALMVQSKQTPSAVTQNRHQMRRWRREADMGDLKWVKYRPFIKNWRLFRLSVWNYLKLLPVEPLHLTSHFSADNCVEFFLHRTVSNTISNDFILSLSFCFLFFFLCMFSLGTTLPSISAGPCAWVASGCQKLWNWERCCFVHK